MPSPGPERRLTPSGFFSLRTPLLPFDEILRWSADLEAPAALGQPPALKAALSRDRALLRDRLASVLERPESREALFLGSTDLEGAMELWKVAPDAKRGPGIERALVRYFTRMTSRPTPFGLFGGCSVGSVGTCTRLETQGFDRYLRHTRVDVDYLVSLTSAILADHEVQGHLLYVPNSSLYRVDGRIRYVEAREGGGARSRHLVSHLATPALDAALHRAEAGATRAELAAAVIDAGNDPGPSGRFVNRLVDDQVLVPALGVPVTGPEALSSLVEDLRAFPPTADVAARLADIQAVLGGLDADGLGAAPSRYRDIAASLRVIGVEVDLSRLVHVELIKPAPAATLGRTVIDTLRRGVAILHRLARARPRPDLDRFVQDFERRYQDREVPLLEALDEDHGIGFGSRRPAAPLLECLSFPDDEAPAPKWGRRETALLRKIMELRVGATELILDDDDLEDMAEEDSSALPLPGALFVVATIVASSDDALDHGDFQVLFGVAGGPSGASLLGRFCHADAELRSRVEQHLLQEEAEDPDAVWAEIVHMPSDKFANVVARPVLRGYEIPYLGKSGAPADRQIPMSDLFVSLRHGQIVLRSRRLGRRVIPRLSTAHDVSIRSLPAYRFLGNVQTADSVAGMGWHWGALSGAPFLPRVRAGRLVLARARWRLGRDELRGLTSASPEDLYQRVASWRTGRHVPRLASLVEGDGEGLLVDFTNVLSVESFVDLLRSREEAVVEELYPDVGGLCARGPEGSFVHEVVVPFVVESGSDVAASEAQAARPTGMAPAADGPAVRRSFPPGTDWLYAKIYSPPSVVDAVLREVIAPLQTRSRALGHTDGWHFVRYGDPDWHLRVRFHGLRGALHEQVLPALVDELAPFVSDGRVWRFQFDTYEREVGRYGGPDGVLLAEQIFSVDSDAVMQLLVSMAPGDQGADDWWRVAVAAADALFDDFELGDDQKRLVLRRSRRFFAKELRMDGRLEAQLSHRFRRERQTLEAWSESTRAGAGPASALLRPLAVRSERLAPLITELRHLESSGRLQTTVADLAISYVHMCLNRLLRWGHRRQELVVYDFLGRMHQSRSARSGPPA